MATQYTAGLTTGQVLTAAIMNQIGAAWETWTPAFAPETGAWTTSVTASPRYGRIQKIVVCVAELVITNFGTGNGAVRFTLPVAAKTPILGGQTIGLARESAINGNTVNVYLNNSTSAFLRFYNNGNTANGNYAFPIVAIYEAA